jgi:hypothetical protein
MVAAATNLPSSVDERAEFVDVGRRDIFRSMKLMPAASKTTPMSMRLPG